MDEDLSPGGNVVNETKTLLHFLSFIHACKNANAAAHTLAKFGLRSEGDDIRLEDWPISTLLLSLTPVFE